MKDKFEVTQIDVHGMAGRYSVSLPENRRDNDSLFKIRCAGDQWPSAYARSTDDSFEVHVVGGMEFDAFIRFMCEYGATIGICKLIK